MNEVIAAIRSRRSVRRYKPEQIGEKELQAILEAGLYAPSAHNDQSWHFTVIQNKDLLARMNRAAKEGMAASEIDWMRGMAGQGLRLRTTRQRWLLYPEGKTRWRTRWIARQPLRTC